MRFIHRPLILLVAGALGISACHPDTTPTSVTGPAFSADAAFGGVPGVEPTGSFMILGRGGRLPANLDALVTAAGGRLTSSIPEIGVAFAEPVVDGFTARMSKVSGIESVAPDFVIEYVPTEANSPMPVDPLSVLLGAIHSDVTAEVAGPWWNETFYSFQWAPGAIQAPEAWAAGHTGSGARVAILDGAIHRLHIDLAANIDQDHSRSFIPTTVTNWDWYQDTGTFWHGTHVAGIVAAGLNGVGTVGIAPDATLIGVKVLHSGSGAFEWILNGIIYAAKPIAEGGAGAHVINMSLGATVDVRSNWHSKDFRDAFRELQKAYDRGTRYAYQQGVTVIASAGNGATNFDVENGLFKFPAQNQHVISISATGPWNWASGATDFERPAYYTDHGKSLVDLSAPGGNFGYPGNELCTVVGTMRTITNPCWVFDGIMSTVRGTTNGNYNWAQGTSMAAPAVAGVAALIIGRNGGPVHPSQVRTRLQQAASDLGDPGNDIWYGHGWVNAYRAVK
jgi:lantibiotic leader peptide-processing serine protease